MKLEISARGMAVKTMAHSEKTISACEYVSVWKYEIVNIIEWRLSAIGGVSVSRT